MRTSVVILAAGQGKRMRSALPKVLHRVGGTCLLEHVVRTVRAVEPASLHVVYGHGGERPPTPWATSAWTGSSRRSSWGPGTRWPRRYPISILTTWCWCCTATCR